MVIMCSFKNIFFLVLFSVTLSLSHGISLCYWGSWANGRPDIGRFGVSDLPYDLCTHIVYSFIGLTANGSLTVPEQTIVDGKSNYVQDLVALKEKNRDLKLLVAIGGWSEGSENFSIVSNNATLRQVLVANIVDYIAANGYDGLDMDWEYPASRGGADTDKEAFIYLLQDLKNEFYSRNWLLTIAVAVTQYQIDISYDVPSINQIVDYIHLMTYDYFGSWDSVTGVNAPLYPVDGANPLLSVESSVNVWLNNGATPSKLVLGLAAYGRSHTLASWDNIGFGAPSTSAGSAGPYTQEAGILSYYEICMDQAANSWNITEVENSYVIGQRDLFYIGYDNPNTIRAKAQFAKNLGFAGVMFWAVDLDDFSGQCGVTFPIIRAAVDAFNDTPSSSKSLTYSLTLSILTLCYSLLV